MFLFHRPVRNVAVTLHSLARVPGSSDLIAIDGVFLSNTPTSASSYQTGLLGDSDQTKDRDSTMLPASAPLRMTMLESGEDRALAAAGHFLLRALLGSLVL